MKPIRQIELLLRIAAVVSVTVTTTTGAPISLKDPIASRSEMVQKVIGTCLQIAPNLPACNFDSEARTRFPRSGDPAAGSGYHMGELPDFLADGSQREEILAVGPKQRKDGSLTSNGQRNIDEFPSHRRDIPITVVYYLEGCLPARLPFDLPSCPIDELRNIQMNRLFPFQLPGVKDSLIFPEIDVKQIKFSHRQSRAPLASQSHEDVEENKDGIGFDGSASGRFPAGNENGLGVQDFHKTIPNSSTIPRIGRASAKYVSKQLPGSYSTSMASGKPSTDPVTNKKKASSEFRKIYPKDLDLKNEGPRGRKKDGNILVLDKNRVQ